MADHTGRQVARGEQFGSVWQDITEAWVMSYIAKNHWRVARTMDVADMIQECLMIYLTVQSKIKAGSTPQEREAYFRVSVLNHFNKLTSRKLRNEGVQREPISEEHTTAIQNQELAHDAEHVGEVLGRVTVQQDSRLSRLYAALFEGEFKARRPTGVFDLNKWLCQMIGADPLEVDMVRYLNSVTA